jgi:hypothetical protein
VAGVVQRVRRVIELHAGMPNTCRTPLVASDLTRASPPVILAPERM